MSEVIFYNNNYAVVFYKHSHQCHIIIRAHQHGIAAIIRILIMGIICVFGKGEWNNNIGIIIINCIIILCTHDVYTAGRG